MQANGFGGEVGSWFNDAGRRIARASRADRLPGEAASVARGGGQPVLHAASIGRTRQRGGAKATAARWDREGKGAAAGAYIRAAGSLCARRAWLPRRATMLVVCVRTWPVEERKAWASSRGRTCHCQLRVPRDEPRNGRSAHQMPWSWPSCVPLTQPELQARARAVDVCMHGGGQLQRNTAR